jgi:hypothetical protein
MISENNSNSNPIKSANGRTELDEMCMRYLKYVFDKENQSYKDREKTYEDPTNWWDEIFFQTVQNGNFDKKIDEISDYVSNVEEKASCTFFPHDPEILLRLIAEVADHVLYSYDANIFKDYDGKFDCDCLLSYYLAYYVSENEDDIKSVLPFYLA